MHSIWASIIRIGLRGYIISYLLVLRTVQPSTLMKSLWETWCQNLPWTKEDEMYLAMDLI